MRIAATFAFMLLLSGSALAAPGFPNEVTLAEGLADEFRVLVSSKLSEIRKTFRMREVRPGEIEFVNETDQRVLTARLDRELEPEGTSRLEETTFRSSSGRMLFKESVFTEGTSLKFNTPAKKIFLEGRADYIVSAPNESRKLVRISSDDHEVFRIVSTRMEDGKSVVTEFFFGDVKVLALRDFRDTSEARRVVEFERLSGNYNLRLFGEILRFMGNPGTKLRAVSERREGYLLESQRYFLGANELFGLNAYLDRFNTDVYTPLILNATSRYLNYLVTLYFPKTENKPSVGRENRFLNELVNLRNQVEQAKTQPSLLATVSTTLSAFINAITEKTLVVTDQRPTSK